MEERREEQRRKAKRDRRFGTHTTKITKQDLAFIRSCPCDGCKKFREKLNFCKEHNVKACMVCAGTLDKTELEALWTARFHLRWVFQAYLDSGDPVKKFAASCECQICAKWRARLIAEADPDESEEWENMAREATLCSCSVCTKQRAKGGTVVSCSCSICAKWEKKKGGI